jgi:ubiquinone/menaquinone biosynthesis C-methylase UbiE
MNKQLVKEQFGAHASAYAVSKVHAQGASLARLVELVQPQAHWQALDVATAAGHTAFVFAPHVAHVTATDITPEMLPVAAKLAQEKGLHNVTVQIADAESLPFEDGRFDLATCRIAPHHFSHIDRFLSEAARVLRPGGLLAVVDNVAPGSRLADEQGEEARAAGQYINDFEKLRDPSHNRALSVDEWIGAFAQAGFTLLHQETAPKEMEFAPWAERMGASPAVIAQLRALLLDAPQFAADFFQPYTIEDKLFFYLTEAILIGKNDVDKG